MKRGAVSNITPVTSRLLKAFRGILVDYPCDAFFSSFASPRNIKNASKSMRRSSTRHLLYRPPRPILTSQSKRVAPFTTSSLTRPSCSSLYVPFHTNRKTFTNSKPSTMPHAESYTEFTPDKYPPFPSGFETVELETISLASLHAGDESSRDRVFAACKDRGFFYLDLTNDPTGSTIQSGADQIAQLAESTFKLPVEEKQKYAPTQKSLFGYKAVGATVTDKDGTRDTAEFFNIAKNDMLAPDDSMSRSWPSTVMQAKPMLSQYMHAAHSTGLEILALLAEKLGVDGEEMKQRHRIKEASGDHVRMTRGPPRKHIEMPEIQTPSHTDFGTITILMNWLGGLQVWSDSSRSAGPLEPDTPGHWLWVRPKAGCAIINLGDAAVKFTNGVLCSGRHRVIPSPGEQGIWPRFSIVYFVRPEDECVLKQLRGEGIPDAVAVEAEEGVKAKEWIYRQARGLGTNNWSDEKEKADKARAEAEAK